MMFHLLLVAAGGALGAGSRFLVNTAALRLFGAGFPVGTMAVNVSGSLLMGLIVGAFALKAHGGGDGMRLFLATGVLGGYTTFSAFSLETVQLWHRGEGILALAYVGGSVVLSLAALVAGLRLARVAW